MKLTAINQKTGEVLLSQSGSMTEDSFRRTVESMFPHVNPENVVLVRDGVLGEPQPHGRKQVAGHSVVWKGSTTDMGGYANMNREICLRLPQHGIQVKLEPLRTAVQVDPMTAAMLRAMEHADAPNHRTCPLVVGFTPMAINYPGRRVVFYTMMETAGLHPQFVERCNRHATEVWVPCEFYEKVFRDEGVTKPVRLMPLGVNHNTYHPGAEEPTLRYEEMPSGETTTSLPNGFRFMSLFGWSYRKGPDVLCRAFLREFSPGEDAILVIYSRYYGSSAEKHKEFVRSEIRSYYDEVGEGAPRIFVCGDEIPIHSLPGCYAAADCFVFCSRGEGFALPVIEAGACGVPVVSAYNTGMTQYLDESTALLVPSKEVAPANEKLVWISEYYRDQKFAVLGEDEVGRFREHMRSAYRGGGAIDAMARNFRERILKEYTWDLCASKVAKALMEK